MNPSSPKYIWQLPSWPFPAMSWDAERILEPISRVNELYGRLEGRMALVGFDVRKEAEISAMSSELASSSAIEGVTLNRDSVRSSVARKLGIELDINHFPDHYIEGLVEIMADAISNANAPLTEERIFAWHKALFPTGASGLRRITVGGWRQGAEPMQVVSGAFGHEKVHFEAPPSEAVPSEMKSLLSWIETSDAPAIVKAAIGAFWFVTIHPFDDGNGRISRTITDLLLARAWPSTERYFSMSSLINTNKKAYYQAIEQSQSSEGGVMPWVTWFLDCLASALEKAAETVDRTVRKALFWDRHRHLEINERQRKVINRLWDGFEGKLSTGTYAKMCHCSPDTALRDIRSLMAMGILGDSGEKARRTNYLLIEEP